jgi:hypothetical protein
MMVDLNLLSPFQMQNELSTVENIDVWLGISAAQLRRFGCGLSRTNGSFVVDGSANYICFAQKD